MRRGPLLIALLAALLLGAPSAVLAAPPNRLEAAAAEPVAGTPLTVFHLSVRYVSSAGTPAGSVTARAGTLEVPLLLASGTATDGTWSGTVVLPVGTWPLSYHVTTGKGPSPSLAGPTLTVAEDDDASPSPEGKPADQEPSPTSTSVADTSEPSAGAGETPGAGPKAPSRRGSGSRTPQPAPNGGGGKDRSPAHVTPEPAPERSGRPSDNGRRRGGAPVDRSAHPSSAGDDTPAAVDPGDTERVELLLLLAAIVAVATITLLGTGWLLGTRDEAISAAALAEARETAARRRRARRVRRAAEVLPAHDPVLAAMGLDDADDGPPEPARGVARGAAPRPRKAPRARH